MNLPTTTRTPEFGLLHRWATRRGALQMAAAQAIFAAVLIIGLRALRGTTLIRFFGLELLIIAAASVALALSMHYVARRFPRDYRLLGAGVVYLVCVGVWVAAAGALHGPLAMLRMHVEGRAIHPLDSWMGALLISVLFGLLYLIYEDARLTALNPERALALAREKVTPQSGLLDIWTLRRVGEHTFNESLMWVILVPVIFTVILNVGVLADGAAARASEAFGRAFPGHTLLWVPLLIFLGHSGLVAARRVAWVNGSMSAVVAVLVVDHIVAAALICLVAPFLEPRIGGHFYAAIALFAGGEAISTSLALYRRAELIATARSADAAKREALQIAEKARAVAELSALQSQIEPHFLYNTLTNLQLLIRQETPGPSKADAMVGHLIDYLRSRLPLMRAPTATLAQELELVRSYLAIVAVRMGSRLSYSVDVPSDLHGTEIPPLVLATLVENSVKHGLEPKRGGGSIAVSAQAIDGEHVEIRVADTGVGFRAGVTGTGVGIANIKDRLRLTLGESAALTLAENTPTGVVATITAPMRVTLPSTTT